MRHSTLIAFALATSLLPAVSFAQSEWERDEQPTPPPVVTYKGSKCQVEVRDSEEDQRTKYDVSCVDKSFSPHRNCTISVPRSGLNEMTFSISTFKETNEGDTNIRTSNSTKPVEFKFKNQLPGDMGTLLTQSMAERCGTAQAKFEPHTIRSRDVDVSGHKCSYQISADAARVEHSVVCEKCDS